MYDVPYVCLFGGGGVGKVGGGEVGVKAALLCASVCVWAVVYQSPEVCPCVVECAVAAGEKEVF